MTIDLINVLKQARKLIENPDNWIKDKYEDGTGKYDLCGAIALVVSEMCGGVNVKIELQYTVSSHAYSRLADNQAVSKFNTGTAEGRLLNYNDSETTTHADILKLIDDVLKDIEDNDEHE